MIILDNYIDIKKKVKSLSEKTKIIVVTKTFAIDKVQPIINAGHTDFGENRVQEATDKWSSVILNNKDIKLHLIGNLQSNKARDAVKIFNFIHSLGSEKLALTLQKEENLLNKKIKYFVQINLAEEENKNGIENALNSVSASITRLRNGDSVHIAFNDLDRMASLSL